MERENKTFVEHLYHDKCGSSDGLSVYQREDGTYQAYCHVCETNYKNFSYEEMGDVTPKKKHKEKRSMNIEKDSCIREIPDRKLNEDVCKRYGVRVGLNPQTGDIDTHYYPFTDSSGKIVAYKKRFVDKKEFVVLGDMKQGGLFGQDVCGSEGKMLVITEGELDCLSAYQLFQTRGKNYRVCSLPNGANKKAIQQNLEWIDGFDNIYLALDQDEPGKKAAKDIASLLPPGKVKIMSFDEKDPSDMLVKGKIHEFFHSFYNASEHRPDGIVSVDDVFDEAIKPVERGLDWPWKTLTDATYGYRRGEIYGTGGGSGGGKTEFFKEVINHTIHHHDLPAGVIFLEEPVSKTLKVLAGKKVNKRFHVPGADWTIDELKDGINDLKGKVYLYNHFGAKDWDSIKAKIRYMVVALGIKDIFLDHLTALVAHEDNEYKALNRIMEEFASMAQELDFTLFYISHLRKVQGKSHEEGGHVSADQFKGSGAIVYWSNFLFGIERNQQAEDEDVRNTTTFRILKDRNTGLSTGVTFQLWYNHDNGRWLEKTDEDGIEDF